jgi:hypothetical protein
MIAVVIVMLSYAMIGVFLVLTAAFTGNAQRNILDVKAKYIRIWYSLWIIPILLIPSAIIGIIEHTGGFIKICWKGK